jgi:hypothetical protein
MRRSLPGATGLASMLFALTATPASAQPAAPPNAPAPPPPPPWTSGAPPTTSMSGATLLPETTTTTPPPPPPAPVFTATDRANLEERIRLLEARVAADETTLFSSAELAWLRRFRLSGYLQPQLLLQSYNTAASPNLTSSGTLPPGVGPNDPTARSNGTTTNGDFFRLRRARLRTEFMPTDGTRFVFEIDPTPPAGDVGAPTTTILRTVEAQGIARFSSHLTTEIAAGVFALPFGFEVQQSDADRPFIERSWGERNMTPGEFDTGARAYTTWTDGAQSVTVQLAVVNGQTAGEPKFRLDPDLGQGKDFVARASFALLDWLDFGASAYGGYGQVVNAAALRYKQFGRWAVNGELGVHGKTSDLGTTRAYAEVTFAQNMDRGVYYSFALPPIPANISGPVASLNERSVWIRVEQDMTRWATLGVRWDEYTPDTSQSNDARDTFGVVGVFHFNAWLQAMLEYDHAIDHVHARGAQTTDAQIETGSLVLQARF